MPPFTTKINFTRELTQYLIDDFINTAISKLSKVNTLPILYRTSLIQKLGLDVNEMYLIQDSIKYSKRFDDNGIFVFKLYEPRRGVLVIIRGDALLENWNFSSHSLDLYDNFTGKYT